MAYNNKQGRGPKNGSAQQNRNKRCSNGAKNGTKYEKPVDAAAPGEQGKYNTSTNDLAWHDHNPELTDAACNFTFAKALGLPAGFEAYDIPSEQETSPGRNLAAGYRLPTFMILGSAYGPGISTGNTSALNLAARDIYSYVRHLNSGHANYDAPDLMFYILQMDSVFTMYNAAMRIMGLDASFDPRNRNMPRYIVELLGFDYDDLITNRASYLAKMKVLAAKIDVFNIPNTMDIFSRHAMLYSSVYKDDDSKVSQLFAFKPDGYYKLQMTAGSPPKMVWNEIMYCDEAGKGTVMKLGRFLRIIEELIDQVAGSEDFQIMNGDIIKAYGSNVIHLGEFPSEYKTPIVYDEVVNSQVRNASITGRALNMDVLQMVGDDNELKWCPRGEYDVTLMGAQILTASDAHSTKEIMESTRLMVASTYNTEASHWINSAGVDFVTSCKFYSNGDTSFGEAANMECVGELKTTMYFSPNLTDNGWRSLQTIMSAQQFGNHPKYMVIGPTDSLGPRFYGVDTRMCEYTMIAPSQLNTIHEVDLLSLYGISAK